MATKQLKPGSLWKGPKAIETIDGVTAHWGYTKDGPVRLVDVDDEYRVAGPDDPTQEPTNIVALLPDVIHGKASTEV